jgi:hypothetical protein
LTASSSVPYGPAMDLRIAPGSIPGGPLYTVGGVTYELPVPSAQVKSCVLIAALLASGGTTIAEPRQSRDHTERLLRRARVPRCGSFRRIRGSGVPALRDGRSSGERATRLTLMWWH